MMLGGKLFIFLEITPASTPGAFYAVVTGGDSKDGARKITPASTSGALWRPLARCDRRGLVKHESFTSRKAACGRTG